RRRSSCWSRRPRPGTSWPARSGSARSPSSRGGARRRGSWPTGCARRCATASLRLFEQALEEQGLPTYVVGGRGYWSQEQVRDGLAYLAALANPRDEEALLAVLASPFCGAGTDALVLLSQVGRESGRGTWAALREADGAAW